MTDEMLKQAENVVAIVFSIIFLLAILTFTCLLGYKDLKTAEMKKEFKKSLTNEHDKALIMEYENIKYTFRKKKNK